MRRSVRNAISILEGAAERAASAGLQRPTESQVRFLADLLVHHGKDPSSFESEPLPADRAVKYIRTLIRRNP